jgi:cytochrome c peroxidase
VSDSGNDAGQRAAYSATRMKYWRHLANNFANAIGRNEDVVTLALPARRSIATRSASDRGMRRLWASAFALLLLGGGVVVRLAVTPAAASSNLAPATGEAALAALSAPSRPSAPVADPEPFDPRVALGRKIFFDARFSEPAGTSCAACHDPARGYSGLNGSNRGVPRGSRAGHFARRTAPSLLYLHFFRRFQLEWEDEAPLPEGHGGFFWDGRSSSVAELVRQPLLNPDEMANPNPDAIARKLAVAPYAAELRAEFESPFATTESALETLGLCLEAFLTSRILSPFSSRYDDFVRGQATLSELELTGFSLFKDAEKGACNSCHRLDETTGDPASSMFTDFGYDTVGAPRNRRLELPAGKYDLGLCERRDARLHTDDPWFCGAFRTPSLRNVALRESFFHNGTFSNLRDAVRFYATRATSPEAWYPHQTFDDLPAKFHEYVNTDSPPYNRKRGDPPALSDAEIDAIVAFLGTLTDRDIPGASSSLSAVTPRDKTSMHAAD